jgi:hypothetical protein
LYPTARELVATVTASLMALLSGDVIGTLTIALSSIPTITLIETEAEEDLEPILEDGMAASEGIPAIERALENPQSLRGATPQEIRRLIPDDWAEKPLRKGSGVRFLPPKNTGESISIEDGWPGHADPLHQGPYVKIASGGKVHRISLEGNPTLP